MPKKPKGIPITSSMPYKPPPERFKDVYEFGRVKPRVRSPLQGWEDSDMRLNPEFYKHRPKEYALVTGKPHSFKARRIQSSYGKNKK